MEPKSLRPNPPSPPDSGSPPPSSVPLPPPGEPIRVVVDGGEPGWVRWVAWGGWMVAIFAIVSLIAYRARYDKYFNPTQGISESRYLDYVGSDEGKSKIAVITLRGVIMEGESFVKKQIDRIRKDDDVKAIVLRVESPGGTITGSDYILHHLRKLGKDRKLPIVVSMGSIAASGGYYVSMAVGDTPNSIFAEPTTTTGSIGVIIPHYDISGLMAKLEVKDDSLASHPRKELLAMTKPMSDDHRQLIMAYLTEAFVAFKDHVKEGRPAFRKEPDRLDKLATGEIFSAKKALEYGLVDKIGFVEDAIARAAELASLDADDYYVVRYTAPTGFMDLVDLNLETNGDPPSATLQALAEMSVPKAWYLCTMLPGLTARAAK